MPDPICASRRLEKFRLAQAHHDYVRVTRAVEHADPVVGYVVDVGTDWLLLGVYEAGLTNGWVALPVVDVESMEVAPEGRFVKPGLKSRRAWPPHPPQPPLRLNDGVRGLLESVLESFPVAALFTERHDRDGFTLGRPAGWTADGVKWQQLGRDATWAKDSQPYASADITRVDVGSRYASAIARVSLLRDG